jgi:hypothetical protein
MSVFINGIEFSDDLKTLIKCPPDKIGKDVIFQGITEIADSAFEGCAELFEIYIPYGIKKIGDRAFYGCEKLKEVIIPESVIEIGDCVFPKHTRLLVFPMYGNLMYPNLCDFNPEEILHYNWRLIRHAAEDHPYLSGVLAIMSDDELFSYGETPLWEWTESFHKANRESYDRRLDFVRCLKNLTMFSENPNYTIIDGVLFDKDVKTLIFCPKWKTGKYVIPESVTKIHDHAFQKCEQLNEVICQNGLVEIAFYAFAHSSIVKIHISDSVIKIGAGAFLDCKKLIKVHLPTGLLEIGESAFMSCENLTEINLPDNVKIGERAFSYCKKLRD